MNKKSDLKETIDRIRGLKSRGHECEVQAMYEVIRLEKTSVLWKQSGTHDFDSFLREENGICTPSRFKAFKRSVEYFDQETIYLLGVPCICLLASQNKATREKLLGCALDFRKRFNCLPNYQYFSQFLRKDSVGPTRTELLRYIDVLRNHIKELGGRIPAMK